MANKANDLNQLYDGIYTALKNRQEARQRGRHRLMLVRNSLMTGFLAAIIPMSISAIINGASSAGFLVAFLISWMVLAVIVIGLLWE